MIKRFSINLVSNPVCRKSVENLNKKDFQYYDKDGFELNIAEQKYYRMMNYPIDNGILNHHCWQETWFELENPNSKNLILDHSIIFHRCNYQDAAAEQLINLKDKIPEAEWLLKTPQKWGFDFALDGISPEGDLFEALHVEYDSYNYEIFSSNMVFFDFKVRHTDWIDAALKIWQHRDKWKYLKGFQQNDWKANFLIGWKKSEYTEKSLS